MSSNADSSQEEALLLLLLLVNGKLLISGRRVWQRYQMFLLKNMYMGIRLSIIFNPLVNTIPDPWNAVELLKELFLSKVKGKGLVFPHCLIQIVVCGHKVRVTEQIETYIYKESLVEGVKQS